MNRMRILIAEDTRLLQSLHASLMDGWGYAYDIANDGYEAIEYARNNRGGYDLCIMDVSMPRVDGLRATRIMRKEVSYFPILGYSMDKEMRTPCLEAGMDAFLFKGAGASKLRHAINDLTAKALLLGQNKHTVTLEKAMPMNPEELQELRELKKNGLTKLKLVGLDTTFIVHKNIQNKISHDFVAERKEIAEFIDRSPDEPGRCHLYKANLYVTKDILLPEELAEAIRFEDQSADRFDIVTDKPAPQGS